MASPSPFVANPDHANFLAVRFVAIANGTIPHQPALNGLFHVGNERWDIFHACGEDDETRGKLRGLRAFLLEFDSEV